mmetsp:Transcript_14856/g.32376  ORF Transcript_14856/g.32376 Transcript_14856/m.32376 type:complete len:215 (-) Transcript_14856:50-694(-)
MPDSWPIPAPPQNLAPSLPLRIGATLRQTFPRTTATKPIFKFKCNVQLMSKRPLTFERPQGVRAELASPILMETMPQFARALFVKTVLAIRRFPWTVQPKMMIRSSSVLVPPWIVTWLAMAPVKVIAAHREGQAVVLHCAVRLLPAQLLLAFRPLPVVLPARRQHQASLKRHPQRRPHNFQPLRPQRTQRPISILPIFPQNPPQKNPRMLLRSL